MTEESPKQDVRDAIDRLPVSAGTINAALHIVVSHEYSGSGEKRRVEWLPLFFVPNHLTGELQAQVLADGQRTHDLLSQNLATVTAEQWQTLLNRASTVVPPMLSALYFDFLWRAKHSHRLPKPHLYARSAAARYEIAALERAGNIDAFWEAVSAARQMGRIGVELNDPVLALSAARRLAAVLDAVESNWITTPGFPLNATSALAELIESLAPPRRNVELLDEVRAASNRLEKILEDVAVRGSRIERHLLEHVERLEKFLGEKTDARRRQSCESMIAEAEARNAVGDHLIAGSLMMDAVELLNELGEHERAAEAKKKVRSWNKAGTQSIQTSWTITIPTAPLRAELEAILQHKELGSLLEAAVHNAAIIPSWTNAQSLASVDEHENSFLAELPSTNLVDGRPTSRDVAGRTEMARRRWTFALRFGADFLWTSLLGRLKDTGQISALSLLDELERRRVLPVHNREATSSAVEAAMSGNRVVACNMLPALVESALRQTLSEAGLDMNAYRSVQGGQIQERTMGSVFDLSSGSVSDRARVILGEDLWNWYRVVLFDEEGINLRNRAAHGLLRDDECTDETAALLLLALAATIRVPLPSKATTGPMENI